MRLVSVLKPLDYDWRVTSFKMKQSQLFWCIPIMCLVTLFGVFLLVQMESSTSFRLTPISYGMMSVVNHELRTGHGKQKILKKIKVRRLASGRLIDMNGNIIPPKALVHPKNDILSNSSRNYVSHQQTDDILEGQNKVPRMKPIEQKLSTSAHNSSIIGHDPDNSSLTASKNLEATLEENDVDVARISQSQDIDKRGKWQMEQVDKYCVRHKKVKLALTLPRSTRSEIIQRKNLFRHLIFDDKRKLLFCFIPKVGCTNMRRFLFVLQGIIPEETITWKHVSEQELLSPGVQKASFLNYSLTDNQRLYKIRNYWKFIILRNPLERLLSAFINKLSSPLDFSSSKMDTFELHKHSIMQRYHPELMKDRHPEEDVLLDFETYLRWIIDTPNYKLNEHFAPTVNLAQPCRIKYHFYGNFKMYSSDMKIIMAKVGAPREWFFDKSSHKRGRETKDLMIPFYFLVSREVKLQLLKNIREDLEFYYTLFPEEAGSHNQILGLVN